jgi:hypothetical protein
LASLIHATAWRIPGVGVMHPRVDRVVIVSTASVGTLKKFLPIAILKKNFHSFHVLTYDGPDPRLKSKISAVGTESLKPWALLKTHEKTLRQYRITQVELAFDVRKRRVEGVQIGMNALIARLDKRWHQRRHLRLISAPGTTVSAGYLPHVPTVYYESRKSSVSMKCYGRRAKLPGACFGACVVRLEWTLTGGRALARHLDTRMVEKHYGTWRPPTWQTPFASTHQNSALRPTMWRRSDE